MIFEKKCIIDVCQGLKYTPNDIFIISILQKKALMDFFA